MRAGQAVAPWHHHARDTVPELLRRLRPCQHLLDYRAQLLLYRPQRLPRIHGAEPTGLLGCTGQITLADTFKKSPVFLFDAIQSCLL